MQRLISTLFREYISTQKLAANSVAIKERAFRHFLSIFGDCQLPSEDNLFFEKYITELQAKASLSTTETYKRNLSSFISWLIAHNYLKDQCRNISKAKHLSRKSVASFRPEELRRIFEIANERWRVIIIFGLCGLRRSEILNLCRQDIDLEAGDALITAKIDSPSTWEWDNKNCVKTSVPLPKTINYGCFQAWPRDEIKGLLSLIPADQPYICLRPKQYSRMIDKKEEGKISFEDLNCPWRSFTRDFGILLKKAEVEHKRFEDLRITYGMNLARKKLKVKSAQKLLRHRKIRTTYGHYQRYRNSMSGNVSHEQIPIHGALPQVTE